MSKKVACGNFVKRQTPESGFSHFNGHWGLLEFITEIALEDKRFRPGYKDGVILVDFDHLLSTYFYSAIVELNENSKLKASYAPRREGEAPFIRVAAKAKKQVAKYASVVLYRHDVLAENNERETDAEWEIVAIKARVTEEEEPMDPYTMARNFLHLEGGTKGDFSAQQFAESIVYWNSHCMTVGKPKWYKKIVEFFREVRKDLIEGAGRSWQSLNNLRD
jgi:hypothetical protein